MKEHMLKTTPKSPMNDIRFNVRYIFLNNLLQYNKLKSFKVANWWRDGREGSYEGSGESGGDSKI